MDRILENILCPLFARFLQKNWTKARYVERSWIVQEQPQSIVFILSQCRLTSALRYQFCLDKRLVNHTILPPHGLYCQFYVTPCNFTRAWPWQTGPNAVNGSHTPSHCPGRLFKTNRHWIRQKNVLKREPCFRRNLWDIELVKVALQNAQDKQYAQFR